VPRPIERSTSEDSCIALLDDSIPAAKCIREDLKLRISRRMFCAACATAALPRASIGATRKIPVILHTDIGGDVDDTFALLWLLRRPELDLKLVVTDNGTTLYKARLTAKLLALGGRHDVTIAYGPDASDGLGAQSAWLSDYSLKDYGGVVRPDGAQAIVDTIYASSTPVTVIGTGPATLTAAALALDARISRNAQFVGMFGSIRKGYGGAPTPIAEFNVKTDPTALRTVLAADWPIVITPVDTCGDMILDGREWQTFRTSNDPFAQTCVVNSEIWLPHAPWMPKSFDLTKTSSVLFDTVAVALAFDEEQLSFEYLPLAVTDAGMTVVDARARRVRVATAWKDIAAFKRRLVADLTAPQAKASGTISRPPREAAALTQLADPRRQA
jgi:inosine-uridine nucleoside N-ribohydrolase